MKGWGSNMNDSKKAFYAYIDRLDLITLLLPYDYHQGHSKYFTYIHRDESYELVIEGMEEINDFRKYYCSFPHPFPFGAIGYIESEHGDVIEVDIGSVTRTPEFDELFKYEGPLGYEYQPHATTFKVWAPTATALRLELQHGDDSEMIELSRKQKGVWQVTVSMDVHEWCYCYHICVNGVWREAVDPYVKAITPNGQLGVIIDENRFKHPKTARPSFSMMTDAIIYETHIRDLTIHPNSGVRHKGLYKGIAEENTTNVKGDSTGLNYMKELGITHIEFLPLNHFAGVDETRPDDCYNWGYNPLHFNVPQGSYASNAATPYTRINELIELIDVIHQNGIRVILDVVYNHVYERETSSFEKIVPGYYFRHDLNGTPSNGTGVGNDIASERHMVRNFIVDSITYWTNTFKVDGFRFDLMGILDVTTMKLIRKTLDSIDSTILVIGEGWDLNTPLAKEEKANIHNQDRLGAIAQFNDQFRDGIKGNTFNLYDCGYALGNHYYYQTAKTVLKGSIGQQGIFNEPFQTVNYVEVHDNHTLWDKIHICFPEDTDESKRLRHRLATAMVLLAQGIPFLHSGQEFFRTKNGEGNSYRSPDCVNQLDWMARSKYKENVEYVKGLIAFRKRYAILRLSSTKQINEAVSFLDIEKPLLAYLLSHHKFNEDVLCYFNPTEKEYEISLPYGQWKLYVTQNQASPHSLGNYSNITLPPFSCYCFVQEKVTC